MVYEGCKIYGPYDRADGRQHVIAIFGDGTRKTVSYPKYLTEKRLGRYLEASETVDHIDGDVANNDPSNLRVLDRSAHVSQDVKRLEPQEFECPMCSDPFILDGRKLGRAVQFRKRGKAGPFCGKSCAGKYGAEVQNGRMDPLDVETIDPSYTTLKDQN
jgi:hypothetical protein